MSIGFHFFPPQCINQISSRSVQNSTEVRHPADLCPGRHVRSSWLYHNGQEVSGSVFPSGFLPPHWLAIGVQSHEHVLLLVAPLCRSVGVVLVLLDAFDQTTVRTKVPLQGGDKECHCQVLKWMRGEFQRFCITFNVSVCMCLLISYLKPLPQYCVDHAWAGISLVLKM